MGYKRISGKETKGQKKELDDVLGGKFMSEGLHKTKIISVGVAMGDAVPNSLTVTFENSFGELQKDNIFLWSLGSDGEFSHKFARFLSAVVEDQDQLQEIVNGIGGNDWSYLDLLRQRELTISIKRQDGYTLVRTPKGYEAIEDGSVIGTFTSILEARNTLINIPKALLYVDDYIRNTRHGEKRQSFFDSVPEENNTDDSNSTEDMGNKRTSTIPSNKRFF